MKENISNTPPDSLPIRGTLPAEREILRVLWNNEGHGLVRSEIHRRIERAARPSLGRVGQILKDFSNLGLISQEYKKAQGSNNAAFSKLSTEGRELCLQLGFSSQAAAYFDLSDTELEQLLTPVRLQQPGQGPSRMFLFHASRDSSDRELMIMHTSYRLANTQTESRILVVDFDFTDSGLHPFITSQIGEEYEGLTGLILNYYQQPRYSRKKWLTEALKGGNYTFNLKSNSDPEEEHPRNLFFLSSGFRRSTSHMRERSNALELLRQESHARVDGPNEIERNFLKIFKQVLAELFERVYFSAAPGLSESTWTVSQHLADTIVFCLDYDTTAQLQLRQVAGRFLERSPNGRTLFLFFVRNPIKAHLRDAWIHSNFLQSAEPPTLIGQIYPTAQWIHDRRLKEKPYDSWHLNLLFGTISSWLDNPQGTQNPQNQPVYIQAMKKILDPDLPHTEKKIWVGILNSCDLTDLEKSIKWAQNQEFQYFPIEIRKTLNDIAQAHGRRIRNSLYQVVENRHLIY